MLQLHQEPAQKVKELALGTAPDRQINVRFTSQPGSGERTEQENVGTSALFEYAYGSADVSLVRLWELNLLFHWFQALVRVLCVATNLFVTSKLASSPGSVMRAGWV
jgi:hypothetical protein